jgi:acyl dehydratase
MPLLFLEDYEVGRAFRSADYLVSRQEIIEFATAWDPQPFHIDDAAARQSMFGGVIACSAHIFAIFCKLSSTLDPPTAALGGLGFDELRMHRPLRPDDTVHLVGTCQSVRRSQSRPDRGIVRSGVELLNARGEILFSCTSTFLVQSRDGGPP